MAAAQGWLASEVLLAMLAELSEGVKGHDGVVE